MQVNALSGAERIGAQSSTQGKRDTVDYDAFLQLLVAQLKNQDPTKPVDSTQYVSQLATLSELEQSLKQTEALERLRASMALNEAGALLGKHVTSADGSVSGIVTSARSSTSGTTLTLEDGRELPVEPNMKISSS